MLVASTHALAGETHANIIQQDGRMLFDLDSSVPIEYAEPIARAMSVWADHLQLSAQRCPDCESASIIQFRFVAGDHGDRFAFQSGTVKVAHVVSSRAGMRASEVHFNSDLFAPDKANRPDIYLVALHEIGHVVGLSHSRNSKSIMYPIYQEGGQILEEELDAVGGCYSLAVVCNEKLRPTHTTPRS